jgi:hypothetical protein
MEEYRTGTVAFGIRVMGISPKTVDLVPARFLTAPEAHAISSAIHQPIRGRGFIAHSVRGKDKVFAENANIWSSLHSP